MPESFRKIDEEQREKKQKSVAPGRDDMVKFHRYTREVWSKLAGRLLTDTEVEQILENFGTVLKVLLNTKVEHYDNQ